MKRLLICVSMAALMTGTAYASNSTSTVTQSNTGNDATVDQSESQSGATSTINQSGANNIAGVMQGDDGLDPTSPTNSSDILQTGSNNQAYVDQKDSGQSSSIEQSSDGNFADVKQGKANDGVLDTSGNSSIVFQAGGGSNTAYVDQIESDNVESFVEQLGTNLVAMVDQSIVGDFDMSDVDQFGDNQFAEVLQPGDFNDSFVVQNGAGNVANVLQSGDGNLSTIWQGLSGNVADVTQSTDNNTSLVDQTASTGGMATVTQ